MQIQDAQKIKEKIITCLRLRDPSLRVHIAKETGLRILFAGAFLSELVSEKVVKISNMKVGSSPVYFIPEQEEKLVRFSEHLKSKEKDAYLLLKEKKFLVDTEQEPAIRIALRAIKDFAIPFEKDKKLVWRFFTTPELEYNCEEKIKEQEQIKESFVPQATILALEKKEEPKKEIQRDLEIFDKKETKKQIPKKIKKRRNKKPEKQTTQEKFFERVKSSLSEKNIEITGVIGVSSKDLTLKVKKENKELLLIAFNKKKISQTDINKAYKKAQDYELPYFILTLSEPSRKFQSDMEAIKALVSIEKIE